MAHEAFEYRGNQRDALKQLVSPGKILSPVPSSNENCAKDNAISAIDRNGIFRKLRVPFDELMNVSQVDVHWPYEDNPERLCHAQIDTILEIFVGSFNFISDFCGRSEVYRANNILVPAFERLGTFTDEKDKHDALLSVHDIMWAAYHIGKICGVSRSLTSAEKTFCSQRDSRIAQNAKRQKLRAQDSIIEKLVKALWEQEPKLEKEPTETARQIHNDFRILWTDYIKKDPLPSKSRWHLADKKELIGMNREVDRIRKRIERLSQDQ